MFIFNAHHHTLKMRIVFFFFFLVLGANVFAQSAPAVTDVTFNMVTWFKHLNADFDKYYKHEKAADLKQRLALLKDDLSTYMKARKKLSDSLFRNNIAPGKKDPANLESLKTKMSTVMGRMRDVTDLTNKELRVEGDKLNDEIYNGLYGEPARFLSSLEAFLDGADVTKKDLAVDGSACYARLEECISNISAVQSKLERKM